MYHVEHTQTDLDTNDRTLLFTKFLNSKITFDQASLNYQHPGSSQPEPEAGWIGWDTKIMMASTPAPISSNPKGWLARNNPSGIRKNPSVSTIVSSSRFAVSYLRRQRPHGKDGFSECRKLHGATSKGNVHVWTHWQLMQWNCSSTPPNWALKLYKKLKPQDVRWIFL